MCISIPTGSHSRRRERFGGGTGAKTEVIINGDRVSDDPRSMTSGAVALETDDDRLVLEFPSGAGVGDPSERPSEYVADGRAKRAGVGGRKAG